MTTWLHEERLQAVLRAIAESGSESILDLGCGDGALLLRLLSNPRIERITGLDLATDSLAKLAAKLKVRGAEAGKMAQVKLIQGSITEGGEALVGFDCAVLLEVIEHIDPGQLSVLERALFAQMHPKTVIITTPNAEFNPLLGVPANRFRHPEHRFEWNRNKFRAWAQGVARRNAYSVSCADIAGSHPTLGGASQMAVFSKALAEPSTK